MQKTESVSSTRFRKIRGGLDRAVKQADERRLQELFIVDCDAHQQEFYSSFVKRVDKKFRGRIKLVDPENDPMVSKQSEVQRGSSLYGFRVKRTEITYPKQQRPGEIVDEFSRRMVEIGIKRSLVLPNMILHLPMDPREPEFEVEVARAYVHYMLDNFLGKYPEILTAIYVPTRAPEKAAELIDDVGKEKGIVGILISGITPRAMGTDDWNPIYEAAQQKDLPVCVHGESFHAEEKGWIFGDFGFMGTHALAFPFLLARHITSAILDGLPERFPRLKLCFMEGGITYIPWLMQRLDDDYVKRRHEAPLLRKLPSEYMNEFYYTTQPLEGAHKNTLESFFRMFDSENRLVYASDYPHWDFDAPSVVYDLPFLSFEAKRKILGENAAKLFKIS